jgi:DNA-binding response OmpR family regulator
VGSEMRQLIFVVDSDANICQLARQSLERAGYRVRTFFSLEMLRERIASSPPALFLLAVGRDDGNSLSFRWHLRQNIVLPKIPAVFLVDDVAKEDQILALADDWIIKPFDPQELIARVQAVLRRSTTSTTAPAADSSELIIDSSGMKLFVRGVEVATTALEFRLIEYLARHHSQVFTRDLLLDAVWGQMQFVSPRCVDACVRRIREKIEPNRSRPTYLKTIRGVGYRLDTAVIWESPVNRSCGCVACTSAEQQFKN